MDRLRSRERMVFNGFTKAETEKLEKLLKESGEQSLDKEFCHKLVKNFNRSSDRAGKPVVKWTEVHDVADKMVIIDPVNVANMLRMFDGLECVQMVQSWFQSRNHDCPSKVTSSPGASEKLSTPTEDCPSDKSNKNLQTEKGEKIPELKELEFEARSSKDGAWYDVDVFLAHRFLTSGEAEVRIRFIGFGAEEDEWVNIKQGVRERSRPLEPSECHNIKVGDLVLCFQERRDQAIHYDAHVLEIQRRLHDIRGCRCFFLIRYDHDNTQERVRLRRLSCRPTY